MGATHRLGLVCRRATLVLLCVLVTAPLTFRPAKAAQIQMVEAARTAGLTRQISLPQSIALAGPVFPPPRGASLTVTPDPAAGGIGRGGGLDMAITVQHLEDYEALYWGPAGGGAIQLALDGIVDQPNETLSLISVNPPGGQARWSGSTAINNYNATSCYLTGVGTNFDLRVTDATGQPMYLYTDVVPAAGAVARITGSSTATFHANLLMTASSGQPVNEFYDTARSSHCCNMCSISHFTGGFYYKLKDSVSGRATLNGQPLSGVTVNVSNGEQAISNISGTYAFSMTTGTYTLTPSMPNLTFDPPSRTVTVPPDALSQDFVACHIAVVPTVTITDSAPNVLLTWADDPGNDAGYQVYRSTNPYCTPGPGTWLADQPAGATSYSDNGVLGPGKDNSAYLVLGRTTCGQASPSGNRTGSVNFPLVAGN